MSKPKHLPKSPKKPPPCELQARRMQLPPHKREPCAPLPRCDYVGRTLTFTPRSGLGNTLLSFASFAALANLTDRHLAVRWARGQNPSSQASFADLFVPPPAASGAPHHAFVNGALLHGAPAALAPLTFDVPVSAETAAAAPPLVAIGLL